METEVKLTKLASCAGCGAKVGAGTLARLLDGFKTHTDPRLIVGYDKSDDASVYVLDENTALVQTTDFFPPIVDDPFLYGQIAAANALSDVYAMGGEPKLALNIMCLAPHMEKPTVQEILRGGYDKAYEAGAIITGGHTIEGAEPIYGLAVSGFVHPKKVLTNSGAQPGDVLILTKPLGVGIITTAAQGGLADAALMERIYRQMATLNKAARDVMVKYPVHSCTDVTGFALLGHSFEMAWAKCHRAYPHGRGALPPRGVGLRGHGSYPLGRVPQPRLRRGRRQAHARHSPPDAGYSVRPPDERRSADRPAGEGRRRLPCGDAGKASLPRVWSDMSSKRLTARFILE